MTEDEAVLNLMGCLLPGGAGFPAARGTGMAPLLLWRLRQADPALPAGIAAALSAALAAAASAQEGAAPQGPAAWTEAASRLEAVEPRLFSDFRKYAYLTYYEQPAVIEAIRALGHPYNDSPLPDGYPDEAFDPMRDAPRHGRGRWTDIGDVRRANLSALDRESL